MALLDLTAHENDWKTGDEAGLIQNIVARMKLITPTMALAYRPALVVKAALFVAVWAAKHIHGAENAMTKVQTALTEIKDSALAS